MKRRIALPALLVLGATLLSACSDGAGSSSTAITLYSGQHVQTTQVLVAAFEKKTGITVNARYDDEDVLADQIVTEGSHSPADVFFTENSPPLEYLASKESPVDRRCVDFGQRRLPSTTRPPGNGSAFRPG